MRLPRIDTQLPKLVVMAAFLLAGSAWAKRTCIPPDQALRHANHDVCVAAHVYRVVDGGSGVHFIDVCSPNTSDANCHFFILTFDRDAKWVGNLDSLLNRDIQIRGTVHTVEGRAEIVFSSRRQLHDGKGRFHPNPRLVASFSAENGGQGIRPHNGVMGQRAAHFHHRGK